MKKLDSLVFQYFDFALRNISFSALKAALPRKGKKRRPLASVRCCQKEIFNAVERELAGSSKNVGYHCMHRNLIFIWSREC